MHEAGVLTAPAKGFNEGSSKRLTKALVRANTSRKAERTCTECGVVFMRASGKYNRTCSDGCALARVSRNYVTKSPTQKLSPSDVQEILASYDAGAATSELAARFRISAGYLVKLIGRNARLIRPAPLKTHCAAGHEMTEDNVRIGKSKGAEYRVCRACQREHSRLHELRRKSARKRR
jgi:hypothetical protein